jgi:antitoxin component YwqK of YwqJK toxin-antitoxin module
MTKYLIFFPLIFFGCASKSLQNDSMTLTSMQIVDRNGFSETISSKDRLGPYKRIDFLTPQPYQKILRVYGKDPEGRSSSKITSYHDNGQVAQYLEVVDGRAHGLYSEWHPNGQLKLNAQVIEGMADIHDMAQASWIFDGKSAVWDEQGHLLAEIFYERGALEGTSLYYHTNGALARSVPFHRNKMDGTITAYDDEGVLIESSLYRQGDQNGPSEGYWNQNNLSFRETYDQGKLLQGTYYALSGELISQIIDGEGKRALFKDGRLHSLTDYREGLPEGVVYLFFPNGDLQITYHLKEGKKRGEEIEYYARKGPDGELRPKISLLWQDDSLQGMVKTWYEEGILESQREMDKNKKHGLSFAWYRDGQLMLMEEYAQDLLVKGSYFKKGDKVPLSKVEEGTGVSTLHTPDGHFLKKISYEKGKPLK